MGLISFNKLLPTLGMNSRDRSTGKISLGLLMILSVSWRNIMKERIAIKRNQNKIKKRLFY